MINPIHVDGSHSANVLVYTLSTCGWCQKTKAYLREIGVAFDYVDVDALEGNERTEVMNELTKWNPRLSFPTVVIDNKEAIVGFQQDKLNLLVPK